ncbi:MAG TPA: hypothetical protein VGM51_05310 [Armatimonadota bacterium]
MGYDSWGAYFKDVGDFAKGEASALNPVEAVKGAVDTVSFLNQSHWSWGSFKDVGKSLVDGLNPFNKTDDMASAGRATMNLTLALSPAIKRIPNPTSIALEGPWRLPNTGGVTLIKVYQHGEQLGRLDWHRLPRKNTIVPIARGRSLPHYHRLPSLGQHHPWQGGW